MSSTPTTTKKSGNQVLAMLEKMKPQMALALPRHLTPDRMTRIVLTEIRKNPLLAQCEVTSLMGAVMTAAQLGLEPGVLGQCYLIPFRNNKQGTYEVQFIIGYQGMISLARRSGHITQIQANVVHELDEFEYGYGSDGALRHRPHLAGDRGAVKCYYAYAKLKDGGEAYVVLSKNDVDKIRKRSKSSGNGPWVTDYDAMACKSCVRQLFKWLPVSVEMGDALELDNTVKPSAEGEPYHVDLPEQTYDVVDEETGEVNEAIHAAAPVPAEKTAPLPAEIVDDSSFSDDEPRATAAQKKWLEPKAWLLSATSNREYHDTPDPTLEQFERWKAEISAKEAKNKKTSSEAQGDAFDL